MSKFTKGKWKTNINKYVYVLDEKNKFLHRRFIVYNVYGDTEEETQANARLIAAAPEMYELISEALGRCKGNSVFADLYSQAKELLARIDGEEMKA